MQLRIKVAVSEAHHQTGFGLPRHRKRLRNWTPHSDAHGAIIRHAGLADTTLLITPATEAAVEAVVLSARVGLDELYALLVGALLAKLRIVTPVTPNIQTTSRQSEFNLFVQVGGTGCG